MPVELSLKCQAANPIFPVIISVSCLPVCLPTIWRHRLINGLQAKIMDSGKRHNEAPEAINFIVKKFCGNVF